MRIGVNVVTNETLDVALIARRAEELGFESLWIPEHPIIPVHTTSLYDGADNGSVPERMNHLPDPFVGLARASAVTRTIKLGTGVCLVPERNPLLLAKEVATLDHLSGGRFIFGIGAGWLKEEMEIMGGNYPHRWSHTREAVLAMKELWTKDESEYHGRVCRFPAGPMLPETSTETLSSYLSGRVRQECVQEGGGMGRRLVPHQGIAGTGQERA